MRGSLKKIKEIFELGLWKSRFIVLMAVLSSMVAAVMLFILATMDIFQLAINTWYYLIGHLKLSYTDFHDDVVERIIGAVDDYLLATVLLIFSLGLYELFISKIESAEKSEYGSKILLIKTLDDLKDRLAKVILMILIVTFFKHVLHTSFDNPLNILYMGGGILLVSLALYFGHKASNK
jgi:uncharacterized membrane protein YqhA